MPIELIPTGEVITMECTLRIPGICLYPDGAGPVLLYKDAKQLLWSACRACAEHAFSAGDWRRAGEQRQEDNFVSQYEFIREQYKRLGEFMAGLLKNHLHQSGIRHSIARRVKTSQSLRQKIERRSARTGELANIPDLLGLRIVTPFIDDVDRIGKIIEREFEVRENPSNSREDSPPRNVFDYASNHYVVKLSPQMGRLPEYKSVANLQAEIQVLSTLQQAWRELAHNYRYRQETDGPSVRRQFERLAGLLELADLEFVELRDKTKGTQGGE